MNDLRVNTSFRLPKDIISTRHYSAHLDVAENAESEHELFVNTYYDLFHIARRCKSSLELLEIVNKRMDLIYDRWGSKDQVYCSQGCNDCCHMNVGLTSVEWNLIRRFASKNKIVVEESIISIQKCLDDDARWSLHASQGRCPFLGESGGCRIYPVRPHACRCCFVAVSGPRCQHGKLNHDVHFAANIDQERLVAAFRTLCFECAIPGWKVSDMSTLMPFYPHHLMASRLRGRK